MKHKLWLMVWIVILILCFAMPSQAYRAYYKGVARSGAGTIIPSATVSLFLAGTSTPAKMYTSLTDTTAVYSTTADAAGSFAFWVSRFDYDDSQKFKVILSKSGYTSTTFDDVEINSVVLGTYATLADTTVTTHISPPKGVYVEPAAGTTLTFTVCPTVGSYKWINGTGTVVLPAGCTPDIRWYGATCDWTGTSSALDPSGTINRYALQQAQESIKATGGKLIIPCRLNIASTFPWRKGITLEGLNSTNPNPLWAAASIPISEIHNQDTAGNPAITLVDVTQTVNSIAYTATSAYRQQLRNMWITGSASSGSGLKITDASGGASIIMEDGTVENCVFWSNGRYGIEGYDRDYSWKISKNHFIDNGIDGVYNYNQTNSWVLTDNQVQSQAAGNGFRLGFPLGCTITGNTVQGNLVGMYLRAARGNFIAGNYFEANTTQIWFDLYDHGNDVRGNFINGGTYGVLVSPITTLESSALTVASNTFATGTYPVLFQSSVAAPGHFTDFVLGPNTFTDASPEATIRHYQFSSGAVATGIINDDEGMRWKPSLAYSVGQTAIGINGYVYYCSTAGTSLAYTSGNITAIADDSSGGIKITSASHGLSNGQWIELSTLDASGAARLGNFPIQVHDVSTNFFYVHYPYTSSPADTSGTWRTGGPTGVAAGGQEQGTGTSTIRWDYQRTNARTQYIWGSLEVLGPIQQQSNGPNAPSEQPALTRSGYRYLSEGFIADLGVPKFGIVDFIFNSNESASVSIDDTPNVIFIYRTGNIGTVKNTASKINIYYDSTTGHLHIQNNLVGAYSVVWRATNAY